jgi:hypothetical protein
MRKRLTAEPMSFLKAARSLLLVLKPRTQVMVHYFTIRQCEVARLYHQIAYSFVKMSCLGNVCNFQKIFEAINCRPNRVIIISKLMRLNL